MLVHAHEQPQNAMDVDPAEVSARPPHRDHAALTFSRYTQDEYNFIVYFDCSEEAFPWTADVVQGVEQRRVLMTDRLLFDHLLFQGGIQHPEVFYPPRDAKALQRLLDTIEETSYDALKKDGLVYFLLKWHRDGRETVFAQQRCIPPQFIALADAYWYLDSGEEVDVSAPFYIAPDDRG